MWHFFLLISFCVVLKIFLPRTDAVIMFVPVECNTMYLDSGEFDTGLFIIRVPTQLDTFLFLQKVRKLLNADYREIKNIMIFIWKTAR